MNPKFETPTAARKREVIAAYLAKVEAAKKPRRDGNAHLLPHQLQGAPGPSEEYLEAQRRLDAKYRKYAKAMLALRNAANGVTSEQ